MSQPIRTRREQAMGTPELLLMVAREVACTRSLVNMQFASREFRQYSLQCLAAIFVPELFLGVFFSKPAAAVSMVKETESIISGIPLREYMYTQRVASNRLFIITRESRLDEVADFLLDNKYSLCASGRGNPFDNGTCASPTIGVRFVRELSDERKIYVTVQGALHHPLRVLFRTTLPQTMQFCDGYRFVDLYPRLGPDGPDPHFAQGRHAHLLDTAELMRKLPPQTFKLCHQPSRGDVVCIDRWLGDANIWVIPRADADSGAPPLEPFGWTIRVNGRRPHGTPYSHFWTTTHCRCLRHAFLTGEYVLPQPAHTYAMRVLERMHDSFAVGVGEVIMNLDGSALDYDIAIQEAISVFRAGATYTFMINGHAIQVEREGCEH